VCHLVVNEVDYDNVGTDDREFVEVFNGTNAAADLTNIAVVLVNGADNNEYSRVALAGSLAPAHYAVVADIAVMPDPHALVFLFPGSTNQIQNGSPDGVALVDTASITLIDALSYEGSITAAQINGFPPVNLVEGTPASAM